METSKKLKTGIAGLDRIFYGGIHLEQDNPKKRLLILARGRHGVNKVHLAMQMCEGLYKSILGDNRNNYNPLRKNQISKIDKNEVKKIVVTSLQERTSDLGKDPLKNMSVNEFSDRKKVSTKGGGKLFDDISSIISEEIIQKYDNKEKIQKHIESYLNQNIYSKDEDLFLSIREYIESIKFPPIDILFISLNKDVDLLRKTYYDYYIQRLIRNVLTYEKDWEKDLERLKELFSSTIDTKALEQNFRDGFLYYNARTHGLHKRVQLEEQKNEENPIWTLEIEEIADATIRFIGRDELNEGNDNADGLTSIFNVIKKINQMKRREGKDGISAYCIMIDGLSCLTDEEIEHCPFSALEKSLREKSKISIVTSDDRLITSKINTDIIIDMAMTDVSAPPHTYNALKISKCLYQRNAYGWHKYKMRNIGIEVIPSLKLQMSIPFLMDDLFVSTNTDSTKIPYKDWLTYNPYYFSRQKGVGKKIIGWDCPYCAYKENPSFELIQQGTCSMVFCDTLGNEVNKVFSLNSEIPHHILFVSLDKSRIDIVQNSSFSIGNGNSLVWSRLHFLNFQPGYIYSDEFLFIIDQHVKAIVGMIKNGNKGILHKDFPFERLYKYVHLFIGDINYINFEYPCLSMDDMFLPAIADYSKKHQMTNCIYTSYRSDDMTSEKVSEKEKNLFRQLQMLTDNQ